MHTLRTPHMFRSLIAVMVELITLDVDIQDNSHAWKAVIKINISMS